MKVQSLADISYEMLLSVLLKLVSDKTTTLSFSGSDGRVQFVVLLSGGGRGDILHVPFFYEYFSMYFCLLKNK